MAISLFCQDLSAFSPDRARTLNGRFGIDKVFALVWPNYDPPIAPIPQSNRRDFDEWRRRSGVKLWGWLNAKADQAADAAKLIELTTLLKPDGWLLDIEGEWTKSAKLTQLIAGAKQTGVPVIASLAGTTPAHVDLDFRGLDTAGIAVDWQCYFDSGEGQAPSTVVREAYESSFAVPGWEYRSRWGTTYGWGKAGAPLSGDRLEYNSYKRVGAVDGVVKTHPRVWGVEIDADRSIRRASVVVGRLLGKIAYSRIRCTLDVTRGADGKHSPAEWTAIAASARMPGLARRPISVYLAENASDETLQGIAAGAP